MRRHVKPALALIAAGLIADGNQHYHVTSWHTAGWLIQDCLLIAVLTYYGKPDTAGLSRRGDVPLGGLLARARPVPCPDCADKRKPCRRRGLCRGTGLIPFEVAQELEAA